MSPVDRQSAVGLGILVAALGSLILASGAGGLVGGTIPLPTGPLQPGSNFKVTLPLASGQVATWGTVLPRNALTADLILESVHAEDPSPGMGISGILVGWPDLDGHATGTALGFPPDGTTTGPVQGTRLPGVGSTAARDVQVLFGVFLKSGYDTGVIHGIRVRYRLGSTQFEIVLPDSLETTNAQD